jgi:hypothetical protein
MRTNYLLISICGISLFLSLLLSAVMPTSISHIGVLVFDCILVGLLIGNLIMGLVRWRKSSRLWMGPAVLCIAFLFAVAVCAKIGIWTAISDWRFKSHISAYDRVIESIQAGTLPCSDTFATLNYSDLPPNIRNIRASCCPDGSMLVECYNKGSSSAGHTGYLFKNYLGTSDCVANNVKLERIWRLHHITGNWYRFAD